MAELPSGLGTAQQATQATAFMRQQPWYLDWLRSKGVTPGEGDQVKLDETQRAELMKLAIDHGIGFNNKFDMIDENGQIAEEHHKLKKIAIAAAIGGLAVTGLGAAGIGPLAGALGGGAAAGGAGAAALPASTMGISGATALGLPVTAVGSGLAALAPAAVAAGSGVSGAVGAGSKLAGLLGAVGKVGGALSGGVNGGATPQGAAYANQEDQLARNRYLETPLNQAGVNTDAQAQRNALRAGLIAKMNPSATPLSVGKYGLPNLAPSAAGVGFSKDMESKLAERMRTGQPLTLSGVAAPSQEELDARKRALDAAGIGSGLNSTVTGIGNTINQGVRLAGLGKGIYDTVKGLF